MQPRIISDHYNGNACFGTPGWSVDHGESRKVEIARIADRTAPEGLPDFQFGTAQNTALRQDC